MGVQVRGYVGDLDYRSLNEDQEHWIDPWRAELRGILQEELKTQSRAEGDRGRRTSMILRGGQPAS